MTSFYLIFRKKNKEFFFQKTPVFLAHCAHFWAKQNVPLNSVTITFFFLILTKYHCAKFRRKCNEWIPSSTGFRCMHAHINGKGIS